MKKIFSPIIVALVLLFSSIVSADFSFGIYVTPPEYPYYTPVWPPSGRVYYTVPSYQYYPRNPYYSEDYYRDQHDIHSDWGHHHHHHGHGHGHGH